MRPAALLIHVRDVRAGLDWYKQAFPQARTLHFQALDFTALALDGFLLEIVQADNKVGAGKYAGLFNTN